MSNISVSLVYLPSRSTNQRPTAERSDHHCFYCFGRLSTFLAITFIYSPTIYRIQSPSSREHFSVFRSSADQEKGFMHANVQHRDDQQVQNVTAAGKKREKILFRNLRRTPDMEQSLHNQNLYTTRIIRCIDQEEAATTKLQIRILREKYDSDGHKAFASSYVCFLE